MAKHSSKSSINKDIHAISVQVEMVKELFDKGDYAKAWNYLTAASCNARDLADEIRKRHLLKPEQS